MFNQQCQSAEVKTKTRQESCAITKMSVRCTIRQYAHGLKLESPSAKHYPYQHKSNIYSAKKANFNSKGLHFATGQTHQNLLCMCSVRYCSIGHMHLGEVAVQQQPPQQEYWVSSHFKN